MRYSKRAKKYIIFIISIIISVITLVAPVSANEINTNTVKVGYLPGYSMFIDSKSYKTKGYSYDYLQEIAKYTGWDYEFYECTWSEALDLLEKGELDIFGPLQINDERLEKFDFPNREMGYEYGALYTLIDSSIDYEDWDKFNGMRVGTDPHNFFNAPFDDYLKKNNISVEIVYTDAKNLGEGLENNSYDAVLAGSLFDIPNTKNIGKICTSPYYFATTKGNTKILNGLNDALEHILLENAYFAAGLEQKHYGTKPINNPAFTADEQNAIRKYTKLRVGYDTNWSIMQYENHGRPKGICVDILKEVSVHAKIPFEFVPLNNSQHMSSQARQSADLFINLSAKENPDLHHTNTYLEIPMLLVGTKQINLDSQTEIACSPNVFGSAKKLKERYPDLSIMVYPSANDALKSLVNAKSDLAYITSYSLDEFARKNISSNFTTISTDIVLSLDIAVNPNLDPAVLSLLNKSISRISSDQINSLIFSNTVDRAYQTPLSKLIREHALTIIGVLTLFSALILFVILHASSVTRKKLEKMAYIDSVTGVLTQPKFNIEAHNILQYADSSEYMLISLDIDRFKYINDTFGYEEGNYVLHTIGSYIQSQDDDILVCRVYADNFLVLCPSMPFEMIKKSYSHASIADQLKFSFSDTFKLKLSIGCYYITDPSMDITSITDKVNFARITLKDNMDVTIAVYTNDMDNLLSRQKDILMNMEVALENHEFLVYLQPKHRLSNHELTGAEALVRWKSPTLGFIMPNDFIPAFEKNGFISRLDYYVFEQVCQLLCKWIKSGKHNSFCTGENIISINLSEYSLMQTNYIESLIELVKKYNLSPSIFEIELTESFRIENIEYVQKKMQQLKDAGFYISIDDFGSGYSSLNLLKDLPVDIIKIDKAFLDQSTDTIKGLKIIESVIQMAKMLNISVVAEGVETIEQTKYLLDMGCDIAQGYFFAKPMPIGDFEIKHP